MEPFTKPNISKSNPVLNWFELSQVRSLLPFVVNAKEILSFKLLTE